MAIYDHKYGELPYFRVFRAWGGKEHQEYVRIKRSREAAYRKAQKIDEELAKRQRAHYVRLAYTESYHIRKDGRVRGLRYVEVRRKHRPLTDVFELRINIPWEDQIRRTTLSIKVHGFDKAFGMAVDKICEWYGLDLKSDVRQAMLATKNLYLEDIESMASKSAESLKEEGRFSRIRSISVKRAKDEVGTLREGLLNAIRKFKN
jgi:hypothetical protein